jgi:starvation-inducible DNA-binding protein
MQTRHEPTRHGEDRTPHGASRADIPGALTALLADVFALYRKTKNLHRHAPGRHFGDYHLRLDDQARQIFGTADVIAERVHELGTPTIKSFGFGGRRQNIGGADPDEVAVPDIRAELLEDNRLLAHEMLKTHELCAEQGDVASASLIETWIAEAKGRARSLLEAMRPS